MNTWPNGYRHAMSQAEHAHWNSRHYPGTLQLCCQCSEPTGRCEEDAMYRDDVGPLCVECYEQPNVELSGGPLGISTTKDGREPSAGTRG